MASIALRPITQSEKDQLKLRNGDFIFLDTDRTLKHRQCDSNGEVDDVHVGDAAIEALPGDVLTTTNTATVTNKTLVAPVISTINNGGTVTLPTSTTTLVGRDTTDTLTNKTLTLPVISAISNTGTITLPTITDTLVGRETNDTLTNKNLSDGYTRIVSYANPSTKSMQFDCSYLTGNEQWAFPNAPGQFFVGDSATQTLTNKTLTSPVISTISNTGTITLPTSTDTLIGRATTDTLTNKTLTAPVISTISNSGTLTLPTGTDTLVGRATTDTLINKTLTSPVISSISNSGTLTLPTSTDTLVGRATTDTLTNKTLTLPVIASLTPNGSNVLTVPAITSTIVTRTNSETLTNKTLTSPVISTISNTGTLTLPTSTDTLIGRATTDTLTNKTMTSSTNVFNGHLITVKQSTNNADVNIPNALTEMATPAFVFTLAANEIIKFSVSITVSNGGAPTLSHRFYHFEIRNGTGTSSVKEHAQEVVHDGLSGTEYATLSFVWYYSPGAGVHSIYFAHYGDAADGNDMVIPSGRGTVLAEQIYCNNVFNVSQTWA